MRNYRIKIETDTASLEHALRDAVEKVKEAEFEAGVNYASVGLSFESLQMRIQGGYYSYQFDFLYERDRHECDAPLKGEGIEEISDGD